MQISLKLILTCVVTGIFFRTYQMAESTFVAPIEYTYLVFAAGIDFALWAVLPSSTTLIGITLVVGSGILITLRELAAKKSQIN